MSNTPATVASVAAETLLLCEGSVVRACNFAAEEARFAVSRSEKLFWGKVQKVLARG